jgi:hypothetical protein
VILMVNRSFVFGVIVGVAGVFVWNRYVKNIPSQAGG